MRKPLEVASDRRSIHAERLRDALHRSFVVAVKVLGDAGLFDGYVKATSRPRANATGNSASRQQTRRFLSCS